MSIIKISRTIPNVTLIELDLSPVTITESKNNKIKTKERKFPLVLFFKNCNKYPETKKIKPYK